MKLVGESFFFFFVNGGRYGYFIINYLLIYNGNKLFYWKNIKYFGKKSKDFFNYIVI